MPDLVGDLLCILKHVGVLNVIAVGYALAPLSKLHLRTKTLQSHDWGAQLAYEAARERPDVFTAVVGITIPVIARPLECMLRETEHHENSIYPQRHH